MSDMSGKLLPIETMPRTGEMVLMWSRDEGFYIGNWPQGCARGEWRKFGDEWRGSADRRAIAATHWMPMDDEPPANTTETKVMENGINRRSVLSDLLSKPIDAMRQARLLGIIEDACCEMAFGKNADGFRYDANDEIAHIVTHAGYAIEELGRRRCTDGQGNVSHDFIGRRCCKCGKAA